MNSNFQYFRPFETDALIRHVLSTELNYESKRPTIFFVHNFAKCWSIFKFFTFGFIEEFAIKSLSFFPPQLNYVATLRCEM